MANSTSIFNNYVEEGSKLSSLKDFFSVFESIGGFIKSLKGTFNDVTGKLTGLYDKLKNSTYLSDWLSKLGLSSDALALVNKYTGGLLTAADSALGDMSGLATKFAEELSIQVLREKYATMHAVGVVGWIEFDSKVENAQKIVAVKMAGSTPSA